MQSGTVTTERHNGKPVLHHIPDKERAAVMTVLVRAALDPDFIEELTDHPCETLDRYRLSLETREALESGDVHWIEIHVGRLDSVERTWLDCKLQQEIW